MFDQHIVQLNLLGRGYGLETARFLTRSLTDLIILTGYDLDVHSVRIEQGEPVCRLKIDGEWHEVTWLNYSANCITQVPTSVSGPYSA